MLSDAGQEAGPNPVSQPGLQAQASLCPPGVQIMPGLESPEASALVFLSQDAVSSTDSLFPQFKVSEIGMRFTINAANAAGH